MDIGISLNISIGIEDRVNLIHNFFNNITNYFNNKYYGDDLLKIIINVVCVSEEFKKFHPTKKPKFITSREYSFEGFNIKEEKLFIYSIIINYDDFIYQTDEENTLLLKESFYESLINLDALPKKIKDFNKEKFISDMRDFLEI